MPADTSADPVILATAGYDHTIRFWQAHSGICHRTVQHPDSQVNALEIAPDKKLIAAAGYQHIRMYDIASNNSNPVVNYDNISLNVTDVGFNSDGKWMYTGGEDRTVKIWDLRSRNLECQKMFEVNGAVNCVCLHPNQAELYIGDQTGAIYCWDLQTNNNHQIVPEKDTAIRSISIDPQGTMMVAVTSTGNLYRWSLTGGGMGGGMTQLNEKDPVKNIHKKYPLKCKFSPDSTLLATTSADKTVRIWRTADFELMTVLQTENQRWVWDCEFSRDSQYIITASSDNMARLWTVDTGEIKRQYTGHQKAVVCLAFRDDISD